MAGKQKNKISKIRQQKPRKDIKNFIKLWNYHYNIVFYGHTQYPTHTHTVYKKYSFQPLPKDSYIIRTQSSVQKKFEAWQSFTEWEKVDPSKKQTHEKYGVLLHPRIDRITHSCSLDSAWHSPSTTSYLLSLEKLQKQLFFLSYHCCKK